ncbi:MAG: hypothetical protein K2X99_09685 [Gemmatimonadaceae bacterium]|nr:hypothetical protein [Gemmatimonadaceae bacterium]
MTPSLDRAALERVLARAVELHVGTDGNALDGDGVSEARILEIAREVGLPATAVRQALAEERARVLPAEPAGFWDRMLGVPQARASRALPGRPADLLGTLEALLTRGESLLVARRFPERLILTPKSGMLDLLSRALDFSGHGYLLAATSEVTAAVTAIDATHTHVVIASDATAARTRRLRAVAIATALGVVLGAPIDILAGMIVAAPLTGALFAGLAFLVARRSWQQYLQRLQMALERQLDRLEYPQPKHAAARLLDAIAPPRR